MKQYYLIMDKRVRTDFNTHADQILKYVCDTLSIDVLPYASCSVISTLEEKRFITVEKLESRTWKEYLSDAMEQISKSDFVVWIEADSNSGRYLQDIILEKYCELTGVKIHTLRIDENTWYRICHNGLPRFIYSQLPDANIYNDKSEDWKE